jgi:hypothetical protein
VGTSFSIEAPPGVMERTFPGFTGQPGELRMDRLPPGVREALEAVVVERPPDYGPPNP